MRLGETLRRLAKAAFVFLTGTPAISGAPAYALPIWSHQYGVTCQKCHTQIPHLTAFGAHFAANGYRIFGVQPGPAFPVAVKVNLVASSRNQGAASNGDGLPKAIVDEIEFLAGGQMGSRGAYFVEQYAVDGGLPGSLREAWVDLRLDPWTQRVPISVAAGSQTLPLPVDPETFRESYAGYAVFEQTVGENPFNFFDPKIGMKVSAGDPLRGTSVQLFAGPGHDQQSGLRTAGTDLMGYVQHAAGPVTVGVYRYEGTRVLEGCADRFERTGFGAVFAMRKWEWDSVIQTGFDSSQSGTGLASSGGFTQIRYAFGSRFFALARYEGTEDGSGAFSRDGVALVGYRPDHTSRVTLEEIVTRSQSPHNVVNLQYTVAH